MDHIARFHNPHICPIKKTFISKLFNKIYFKGVTYQQKKKKGVNISLIGTKRQEQKRIRTKIFKKGGGRKEKKESA